MIVHREEEQEQEERKKKKEKPNIFCNFCISSTLILQLRLKIFVIRNLQ